MAHPAPPFGCSPRRSYEQGLDATPVSACCNTAGKIRPSLSTRLRMPLAALGESEYFGDTRLCRTADKEHATAELGNSEELRVKNAVADNRPAFP